MTSMLQRNYFIGLERIKKIKVINKLRELLDENLATFVRILIGVKQYVVMRKEKRENI